MVPAVGMKKKPEAVKKSPEKYKAKIEELYFRGADRINRDFLETVGKKGEEKKFTTGFLEQNKKEKLAPDIVCTCLNIFAATPEGKNFATGLLE